MQRIASYPKVTVTAGGRGVCSHVGSRLLADVAAAAAVGEALDAAVGGGRRRRSAHLPGRVLADVAVMLADGGEAIADLAVLRNQPGLFGLVASTATAGGFSMRSTPTAGCVEAGPGGGPRAGLVAPRRGRPGAPDRHLRWPEPSPGLVIDIDATLVTCHSPALGTRS